MDDHRETDHWCDGCKAPCKSTRLVPRPVYRKGRRLGEQYLALCMTCSYETAVSK